MDFSGSLVSFLLLASLFTVSGDADYPLSPFFSLCALSFASGICVISTPLPRLHTRKWILPFFVIPVVSALLSLLVLLLVSFACLLPMRSFFFLFE